MEILVFIVLIIVSYKIYGLFESLYNKLPHRKIQQQILLEEYRENYKNKLLGKYKLNEYHYDQDCDLITNYEKPKEKCWSNSPSVWIGDEVLLLWYFGDNKKPYVWSFYEVLGFDEYKVIKSDELVIERRRVRKNHDTTKVLEIGDTIYRESANNKGVWKHTYKLSDLSFNSSTQVKHTGNLTKEDLKIITFGNQEQIPHIILLQTMIKNIIVLRSKRGVHTKYLSKWRFYTHLRSCRGFSIDNEKKDNPSTKFELDDYILSFHHREMNPVTKSQYFSEIQNSILKRNPTVS